MLEQRFRLASGNFATVTPGVLRVGITSTGEMREFDLVGAHVHREGVIVTVVLRGERLDLPAASLVDAGQLEVILRDAAAATHAPVVDATERPSTRWVGVPIWGWLMIGLGVFAILGVIGAIVDDDDEGMGRDEYARSIRSIARETTDSVNAAVTLENTRSIGWQDEAAFHAASWPAYDAQASALDAPTSLNVAERDFNNALKKIASASAPFREGLGGNPISQQEARSRLTEGLRELEDAERTLQVMLD